MQIMVSRRSSCKSLTGFYRFSLVSQLSLNDLSIIFQWSSPKMWQFLRDCRKIIEWLVKPLSAHWEIAERLLKDHWKTIFMKDCRKTILNRFKFFWRPWRPWNSLKDHLGIMKDLRDHWKFTERSLRDLSIFRVFQRYWPMGGGGGGVCVFDVLPATVGHFVCKIVDTQLVYDFSALNRGPNPVHVIFSFFQHTPICKSRQFATVCTYPQLWTVLVCNVVLGLNVECQNMSSVDGAYKLTHTHTHTHTLTNFQ